MNKISICAIASILFFFLIFKGKAQKDTLQNNNFANIYLDCNDCDVDYIKEHLTFVNYVRERRAADIHILVTGSETGSGGFKAIIVFYGQNRYANKTDTLSFSVKPNTSDEVINTKFVKILKIGILFFLTESDVINNCEITYHSPSGKTNQIQSNEDPWNYWVFHTNLSGRYNGESSYQNYVFGTRININRITEKWKLEFSFTNRYNETHYLYGDNEILGITRNYQFSHLMVKSISNHWSVGHSIYANSSSYNNIEYSLNWNPAIEYDIYPYSESTIRQFRIMYSIGPIYNNYIDITVFDKTEELLFSHSLKIAYETNQKWGNIGFNISSGSYLHDFSLNYARLSSDLSLNLFKGFSFNLYGAISFIHNQISLSKGEVSLENVLIRTQQLPTTFSYYCSLGVSYTFGSIYNNVVNPRFD